MREEAQTQDGLQTLLTFAVVGYLEPDALSLFMQWDPHLRRPVRHAEALSLWERDVLNTGPLTPSPDYIGIGAAPRPRPRGTRPGEGT